jgi:hypothetical protein
MEGHTKGLEEHHLLWIRRLWEHAPYVELREHRNAKIRLTNRLHHGILHPRFYCCPMPLPPVWAVHHLKQALDSAVGGLDGLERMIRTLGKLLKHPRRIRGSVIDEEDRVRLENLRCALTVQLNFLRSENVTD